MKVALALGGGGVKGVAHIGVIRCLERHGFEIQCIAGTSAGGLVGALYAAGYSPDQMSELLQRIDRHHLWSRRSSDGPSFLGLAGITEILTKELGDKTFADLRIPFGCVAVDINTASEVSLVEGKLVDAVLATIAVPGIFPARIQEDSLLVDGGVLNPVPVSLARWLVPGLPVLAVVLSPAPKAWAGLPALGLPVKILPSRVVQQLSHLRVAQAFNIFVQSMDISSRMLTELRLQIDRPEIIIRPDVGRFGLLAEINPGELIEIGENAACSAILRIRRMYSWPEQRKYRVRPSDPLSTHRN